MHKYSATVPLQLIVTQSHPRKIYCSKVCCLNLCFQNPIVRETYTTRYICFQHYFVCSDTAFLLMSQMSPLKINDVTDVELKKLSSPSITLLTLNSKHCCAASDPVQPWLQLVPCLQKNRNHGFSIISTTMWSTKSKVSCSNARVPRRSMRGRSS